MYSINPDDGVPFDVYCDQTTEGGGWTVIQKRFDGSVNFYLDWADYKRGFGSLGGEFWLGLDKICRLTKEGKIRLRVELTDHEGNTSYADYDFFAVASEKIKYRLSLGKFSGERVKPNSQLVWFCIIMFTKPHWLKILRLFLNQSEMKSKINRDWLLTRAFCCLCRVHVYASSFDC